MNYDRREFLKKTGTGVAAMTFVGSTFSWSAESKNKKPNMILFLTDDQGWVDTSVQMMRSRPDSKSDYYQTPNLERLAREGMVFSNAYSPAPICVPTRHSIQFGKTPSRLRNTGHYTGVNHCENERSIAQVLKAADSNYVTAHFGKWGLHHPPEYWGYDKSDGQNNNYHGDWRSVKDKRALPADDPKRIFSLTRRANEFMQAQVEAGRPFFMQVSHYAPHVQHRALKKTIEKYKKLPPGGKCRPVDYESPPPPLNDWVLEYAAMIEDLDTGLGMLLDKLDKLGIAENTYIIFTSNNGGGFKGCEPLRAGKASLYEGGLRVPTVVRGPGIKPGCR